MRVARGGACAVTHRLSRISAAGFGVALTLVSCGSSSEFDRQGSIDGIVDDNNVTRDEAECIVDGMVAELGTATASSEIAAESAEGAIVRTVIAGCVTG